MICVYVLEFEIGCYKLVNLCEYCKNLNGINLFCIE